MVLSGMTIGEKPLKDHLEATGHRDAFCFLEDFVKSGDAISEAFVRQLHSLVLADKPILHSLSRWRDEFPPCTFARLGAATGLSSHCNDSRTAQNIRDSALFARISRSKPPPPH